MSLGNLEFHGFRTNTRGITDIGNNINPYLNHNFPQNLCANSHVSSFFIDIVVLYPNVLLIFLGAFIENSLPMTIIVNGMSKSIISMNIQKNIISLSSVKFRFVEFRPYKV